MTRSSLILGLIFIAGCQTGGGGGGGGGGPIETSLVLDEGLGTFEAQAGEPTRRTGTVTFNTTGNGLGGGAIEVNAQAIEVTPTGGAKGAVALQGGTLTVTVWVAPLADLETVCDSGDQYGPFDVTLNESNVPVSVDPSSVDLTQQTLDLLAAGEFSICIEVVSPIDATVSIQSFQFSLDLGA